MASTWGSDETIRVTPALLCRLSPAEPSPTGPSLPLHQPWEPMPERHGTPGLMPFQTQRGAPTFTTVSSIVVNSDMTRSHPFKGRASPVGGKRSSLCQVTVTEQTAEGTRQVQTSPGPSTGAREEGAGSKMGGGTPGPITPASCPGRVCLKAGCTPGGGTGCLGGQGRGALGARLSNGIVSMDFEPKAEGARPSSRKQLFSKCLELS